MQTIERTPRGDGKGNFFEVDLSEDKQKVRLTLIVDGKGTWMELDAEQNRTLMEYLLEYHNKLPK